ncbi:hypothetical protein CDG79_39810, partial [Nostoc sp. 'Peltigera membranacea cyanobiont' 232]
MQMRLQQLEDNVVRVLKLLNDYQVELSDESDPGTKNKYRRRIEDLKKQRDEYESELIVIQEQLTNEQPEGQVSIIASQLQQIDNKLNWLADSQAALHQVILAYFTTEEKALIAPIARQLEEAQIVEVQSVLEAVESNQVSEEETKLVVAQLQQTLALLKGKDSGGRVLTKGTLEEDYHRYERKPASRIRPRKLEPVIKRRTG